MKKILSIALALTMMLSLAACGQKEDTKVPAENDKTIEETQKPVENVEEKEEASTETTKTETEKEEANTEDNKETEPSEDVKGTEETEEPEVNDETTTEKNTEEDTNEDVAESTKGVVTLAEGSSLKVNSELSGLYKIQGYMRSNFMGNISFTAGMVGINVENEGDVDLSKANITDELMSIFDYTYFSYTFDGEKIVDWDIVDRKTNESVLGLTDEEINNKYFPENNYETVESGDLPETINLSNYEVGKIHAFNVPSDGNFSIPKIINDTDYSMLIVSTKDWDGNWERTYKSKYYMPDNSSGSTFSDDGKYYISITEGDPSDLFSSDECFLLAGHEIGEELDFDFEDYIGNNTDKTITVKISDWGVEQEFKLLPGEILESSWMNDATITNIE